MVLNSLQLPTNLTGHGAAVSMPPVWSLPPNRTIFLIFTIFSPIDFIYMMATTALLYVRRHHSPSVKHGGLRLLFIQVTSGAFLAAYFSLITSRLHLPCFIELWFDNIFLTLYAVSSTARTLRYIFLKSYDKAKLTLSIHGNLYIQASKDSKVAKVNVNSPSGGSDTLRWYRKKRQYASDKALTRTVLVFVLVIIALTGVIYIINNGPGEQFEPSNTICRIFPGMTLTFLITVIFIGIIAPFLGYKLSKMNNDAFFIRTDLLTTIFAGFPCIIAFFVYTSLGGELHTVMPGHVFLLLAFNIVHFVSIIVPLIATYRDRKTNNKDVEGGKATRAVFEKVIADEQGFDNYKLCAAATFTTELMVFLDDYQQLKKRVVRYFTRHANGKLTPIETTRKQNSKDIIPVDSLTLMLVDRFRQTNNRSGQSNRSFKSNDHSISKSPSKESFSTMSSTIRFTDTQDESRQSRRPSNESSQMTLTGTILPTSPTSMYPLESIMTKRSNHSHQASLSSSRFGSGFVDIDTWDPPERVTPSTENREQRTLQHRQRDFSNTKLTTIIDSIGKTLGIPQEPVKRIRNKHTSEMVDADLHKQGQFVFGKTITALRPDATSSNSSDQTIVQAPPPMFTRVPQALESYYSQFYDRFFLKNSDCELNIPNWLLDDIKHSAKHGYWRLDMYDHAHAEVLNMLYENTFQRYQKMFADSRS